MKWSLLLAILLKCVARNDTRLVKNAQLPGLFNDSTNDSNDLLPAETMRSTKNLICAKGEFETIDVASGLKICRRCTLCGPGFEPDPLAIDVCNGIGTTNRWCVPCRAEHFKSYVGSDRCMPCETVSCPKLGPSYLVRECDPLDDGVCSVCPKGQTPAQSAQSTLLCVSCSACCSNDSASTQEMCLLQGLPPSRACLPTPGCPPALSTNNVPEMEPLHILAVFLIGILLIIVTVVVIYRCGMRRSCTATWKSSAFSRKKMADDSLSYCPSAEDNDTDELLISEERSELTMDTLSSTTIENVNNATLKYSPIVKIKRPLNFGSQYQ